MKFKNAAEAASFTIPKGKFTFVQKDEAIHDKKLQTKPIGYFKDALMRFSKNRGSLICFWIIVVLVLYSIIVPFISSYEPGYKDSFYSYATPKNNLFAHTGFWDGGKNMLVNRQSYDYYANIPDCIIKYKGTVERNIAGRVKDWYSIRIDTYKKVGWVKKLLTKDEYEEAKNWEKKTGIQLFYPVIDQKKVKNIGFKDDMNAWFLTDRKGVAKKTPQGKLQSIYLKDEASKDGYRYAVSKMGGEQLQTRVLYSSWYRFKNGKDACYIFGADESGHDIFSRLALGARLSLLLSLCVASINLLIGIIVGAFEGYYGGRFDLIVERLKEIIYEVPFMVTMALFQLYLSAKVGPVVTMFFAFIFCGWIATSNTVRAQFYRFKGSDYVMAARTLGAKDSRLIFRHILPNAIGFIITTSVLTIPAVILSESTLTYLGIVNLQTGTLTSVGTLLKNGQASLSTSPHCVFFPALFISVLLVCFNEFGNGLRDAFNPSLRGAED